MATTPEGKVKGAIKAYLRTLVHCFFFMPAAHGYGVNGIPDIIGCYKGIFFAIEVKAPGKLRNVTALQRMQINQINQAQGWAIAADSVQHVHELFELIDRMLAHAANPGRVAELEERVAELEAQLEAEDRNRQEA
jgi:BMFP domain-containing protein YqiC